MLRHIDIPRLLLQILRPNYAVTYGFADEQGTYHAPQLNTLYKFLLCLLYPLKSYLDEWDIKRRKSYAIAACQYGRKQILAILNKYYGQYGQISMEASDTTDLYLYPENSAIPIAYYCWKSNSAESYIYTLAITWSGNADYFTYDGGKQAKDKNTLDRSGEISYDNITAQYTRQASGDVNDMVYLYPESYPNAPTVYFGLEGSTSTNTDILYIPQELADSGDYQDFLADLNAMIPYGLSVTIKTIQL